MQCMRDHVTVINDDIDRGSFLSIDNDLAAFDSVFLDRISID